MEDSSSDHATGGVDIVFMDESDDNFKISVTEVEGMGEELFPLDEFVGEVTEFNSLLFVHDFVDDIEVFDVPEVGCGGYFEEFLEGGDDDFVGEVSVEGCYFEESGVVVGLPILDYCSDEFGVLSFFCDE